MKQRISIGHYALVESTSWYTVFDVSRVSVLLLDDTDRYIRSHLEFSIQSTAINSTTLHLNQPFFWTHNVFPASHKTNTWKINYFPDQNRLLWSAVKNLWELDLFGKKAFSIIAQNLGFLNEDILGQLFF